ncbi:MAG: thioredoxin domain-containing protein [Saprospiraceae bacterium]|nr:thioredoxin domain-containing protein [Pyrinomonadaceae bacterium]
MKFIALFFFLIVLAFDVYPQKAGEVLATAAGLSFTPDSLSENGRKIFNDQKATLANARSEILSQMLADMLLEAEAKSRNISVETLVETKVKKIPVPSAADIKAVYDANRAALGDKTLEEAKKEIVEYLLREPEQKALQSLIDSLKIKHKFALGKDVNAANLNPMESLGGINGRSLAVQEFEAKNKGTLYDIQAEIADEIKADLENSIFSTLLAAEAKSRSMEAGDVYAAEITNKMREFSDEEKAGLQTAFKKTLFAKFNVKILLKEPVPFVQDISADDDPSQGKAAAPVTIIMFTDFQCPACSATHPVLKKVVSEYGDNVRFVIRDFPLTNIHENALAAARAANAANLQGKFFEFIDILYRNQTMLDTDSLKKYAAGLGLNVKQFEIDLSSEKIAAEVGKDMADGKKYGIGGTPAIFVNGVKVRRLSAQAFRDAVDKALKK